MDFKINKASEVIYQVRRAKVILAHKSLNKKALIALLMMTIIPNKMQPKIRLIN